ncbi:hypothetical protein [Actinocrispum wychmicini]|uniref:hypothetical protein n=1 Tax=Actinocrispum wychmicini TaxID=1213861 RepID=UPI001042C325|nr:hypothetical protein [Actinocrispum wychmicini]
MTGIARFRALLVAGVALALVGGLTLVSMPPRHDAATPEPAAPIEVSSAPSQAGIAPPPSMRTDAVQALLHKRADAVVRRDEKTFMAGIDPQADPVFVKAQLAMFANLAGVPFREWSYSLQPQRALDPSALPAVQGAEELWAPETQLVYALRGSDTYATQRPMGYLFVRRAGTWYLHSDTDLQGVGRKTWRGLWDFGPCMAVSTGHGLVIHHPARQAMAQRVANELDAAVNAVSEVWGRTWPEQVVVLLPDTAAEMRALVGPSFPVDSVVAVSIADVVDTDKNTAAGQRVVMSPTTADGLSVAALRIVLRHEITHIAARGSTVDGSPMWLLEGFADYVGYRESGIPLGQAAPDLTAQMTARGPPDKLPADDAFRSQGATLDLAYQQSLAVARFVADKFGEPKLLQLYRTLAKAGRTTPAELDKLLHSVTGLTTEQFVAGWREYLRETLG